MTRLSSCPPGQFGQDCSCRSDYPSGTCANGTWTIAGGFLTSGHTWDIKSDRFYIQGNFRLSAGAFILINVDLVDARRSGFISVNGQVDLMGAFVVNIVSSWDTSVARIQMPVSLMSFASITQNLPYPHFPNICPGRIPIGECWRTGEEVYVFDPVNRIIGTWVTIVKETDLSLCDATATAASTHVSVLIVTATIAFLSTKI